MFRSIPMNQPRLKLSRIIILLKSCTRSRCSPADIALTSGGKPPPDLRTAARRNLLSVALAIPALLAPLSQVSAAEAREVAVEINYTWTLRDLSSVPTGEDSETWVADLYVVLTPNTESGLPNLGGQCVVLNSENKTSGEFAQSGDCVFRDIDGDAMYEHFVNAGPGRIATITGGTGKFNGISGELEIEGHYYASPKQGIDQGIGVKKGTLRMPAS